jgi:hypothetical protein
MRRLVAGVSSLEKEGWPLFITVMRRSEREKVNIEEGSQSSSPADLSPLGWRDGDTSGQGEKNGAPHLADAALQSGHTAGGEGGRPLHDSMTRFLLSKMETRVEIYVHIYAWTNQY